jgi:hypothetical protein
MEKVYAELIYINDPINKTIINEEFTKNDTKQIMDIMSSFYQNSKNTSNMLCLDLHNVTDLYPIDTMISQLPICVLSYVGRKSNTRNIARDEIKTRITFNICMMGILIFERPPLHNIRKCNGPIIMRNDVIGSKAWIINFWRQVTGKTKILFIDDGSDHIELVNMCKFDNVISQLVSGTKLQEVIDVITNLL